MTYRLTAYKIPGLFRNFDNLKLNEIMKDVCSILEEELGVDFEKETQKFTLKTKNHDLIYSQKEIDLILRANVKSAKGIYEGRIFWDTCYPMFARDSKSYIGVDIVCTRDDVDDIKNVANKLKNLGFIGKTPKE